MNSVLFAMLVAQQYGPAEYNLQDWLDLPTYQTAYCDPTTGRCDLYPAFADAVFECDDNPPRPMDGVGCVIRIPAGDFRWSAQPEICRSHSIIGPGGDADTARVVLYSDENVGCFSFRSYGYCDTDGPTNGWGGSGGAELIGVACVGNVTTTTTNVIGVFNESGANLKRVTIRKYVQGYRIDAGVGRPTPSNANVFLVEDVHLWNHLHAGFIIDGPDANAGLALAVDAIDNCRDSSWDTLLGSCSAQMDLSFLGNTHISPHTSLSGGGAMEIGDSANSTALVLNPYIEGPSRGIVTANAQIFGATGGNWRNNLGLTFLTRRPNGLEFVNDANSANVVALRVGNLASADSVLDATALSLPGGFAGALRLKARPGPPKVWGWNIGNLSPATDAMQITMTATTGVPAGTPLFP